MKKKKKDTYPMTLESCVFKCMNNGMYSLLMIYEMHLCKDQTITLDEVKVY